MVYLFHALAYSSRFFILRGLRILTNGGTTDKSGAFLDNCQVVSLPNIDFPAGEPAAKQLWELSEKLVGQEFKLS